MHLGLYQRVWIISFMHAYVFLLAFMLFIHVCLSRSRLCHALCPPWACAFRSLRPFACVVTSTHLVACRMWPLVRHISVMLVCLIHTFLYCVRCFYACFVPPIWLSLLLFIFTHLFTCSCISFCVIHTPIQWSYGHRIQTYICPPRTPSFFL